MDIDTTQTYTGTVEWFGGEGKNFGFIKRDDRGANVFVHLSAVGRAGLREIKRAIISNSQSKLISKTASRKLQT